MNRAVCALAALVSAALLPYGVDAAPPASQDLVKARQFFFGKENVNAQTGEVDNQKVIFSWLTNSTIGASVKGRIVLLDSYIHRAETVPGRTPFVLEDLVKLAPEAIFLGHGHFDHADNAAFIAGLLGIPIYASQETCAAMQVDAANLYAAGRIPVSQVTCNDVTTTGSIPGTEVVKLSQLEPVACITAFRHLHSNTPPANRLKIFPGEQIAPVKNDADPRDPEMYPPGTAHSFRSSGGPGGPISIAYQFVLRGDNRFSFLWHNTTGALRESCGLDKCWDDTIGPQHLTVGENLVALMRSLSPTDIEFGSMVTLGWATTGMRDPILYNLAIRPKIYIPVHQTNAAQPTSALRFKVAYLQQLIYENVPEADRPEARWMVDPDDYVRPMVYDPKDPRWAKPAGQATGGLCK